MSMLAYVSSTVLVIAAAVLVAALVLARRTRGRGAELPGREPTLVAVQGALAVALITAAAIAVVVLSVDQAHQDWMGLPLALAPGLAASAGLLVVALTPALRSAPGATRSASLRRRGTWTVGSRLAYLRPALVAVVLGAVLLTTGLTASPDDAGLSRAFSLASHDGVNRASPYPGWYYAGPLLLVTALLLLTATLAMRRIAALPALQSADEQADAAWRRTATSAISLLATAGLLGYLAGVVLVSGGALESAGEGVVLGVLGGGLQLLALLIGVLTCVCLGLAVLGTVAFQAAIRGPQPLPE